MERLVFTGIFSFCLSGMMSGWVTYINLGLSATFLHSWSLAFVNAWPAAFVAAWLINPLVRVLTAKIMRGAS